MIEGLAEFLCGRFSRHLRWLLLVCLVGLCGWLALITVRERKGDVFLAQETGALLSLRDFHTFLHEDGLRLRVSGDSLSVSPLKLLGPFRLGVAHSLTARAVTIETFPDANPRPRSQSQAPSFGRLLASLKPSFNRFLASLLPGQAAVVIVQAECGPLKIVQREGDQLTAIFAATSCQIKSGSTKVICKDGILRVRGGDIPFHELSYDGQTWKVRTALGRREIVDADLFLGSSPG